MLSSKRFKYQARPSALFGTVRRPFLALDCFSVIERRWVTITNLLADTGADISVFPQHLGTYLVGNLHRGTSHPIKGVVPGAEATVYVHHVLCRLNGHQFRMPVAIAETNDVPLIFGRVQGLDRFLATFANGRSLQLRSPRN